MLGLAARLVYLGLFTSCLYLVHVDAIVDRQNWSGQLAATALLWGLSMWGMAKSAIVNARTDKGALARLTISLVMAYFLANRPWLNFIFMAFFYVSKILRKVIRWLSYKELSDFTHILIKSTTRKNRPTVCATTNLEDVVKSTNRAETCTQFIARSIPNSLLVVTTIEEWVRFQIISTMSGSMCIIVLVREFKNFIPLDGVFVSPRIVSFTARMMVRLAQLLSSEMSKLTIIYWTWTAANFNTDWSTTISIILTLSGDGSFNQGLARMISRYIRTDYIYMKEIRSTLLNGLNESAGKNFRIFALGIVCVGFKMDIINLISLLGLHLIYMKMTPDSTSASLLTKISDKLKKRGNPKSLSLGIFATLVPLGIRLVAWDTSSVAAMAVLELTLVVVNHSKVDVRRVFNKISKQIARARIEIAASFEDKTLQHTDWADFILFKKDAIRLSRYGSRGDFLPIEYIASILKRFGVDNVANDVVSAEEGGQDLAALERLDYMSTLNSLQLSIDHTEFLNNMGITTLGNGFSSLPNTDNLIIKMCNTSITHGIGTDSILFDFIYINSTESMGIFSAFDGRESAMPFSADAKDPIVFNFTWKRIFQIFTRGKKRLPRVIGYEELRERLFAGEKGLVCTGSSSAEPDLGDLGDLVDIHTSSKSIASTVGRRWIGNRNHQKVFRNYDIILTHGGAGTVKTALAAGCDVFSLCSVLDRDLKEMSAKVVINDPDTSLLSNMLYFHMEILCTKLPWIPTLSFITALFRMFVQIPLLLGNVETLRLLMNVWVILGVGLQSLATFGFFMRHVNTVVSSGFIDFPGLLAAGMNKMFWSSNDLNLSAPWLLFCRFNPLFLTSGSLLWAILMGTFRVISNVTGSTGTFLSSIIPIKSESSNSRWIEVWTSPTMYIFTHSFLRVGDVWYQFEFMTDPPYSHFFPRMRMIELHTRPEGDFKVYRTTVLSSEGPKKSVIDFFKKIRPYNAINNCLTGTFAFLSNCKVVCKGTTTMLLIEIFKSAPLLAICLLHNMYIGRKSGFYFSVPTLGWKPNLLRVAMKKANLGSTLTSEEVATLLLNKYSVDTSKPSTIKLTLRTSVGRAYLNSRLGPWFKYQKDFVRFHYDLDRDQTKAIMKEVESKIEEALPKDVIDFKVQKSRHSVKYVPKLRLKPNKRRFLDISDIGTEIRPSVKGSFLQTGLHSLVTILRSALRIDNKAEENPNDYLSVSDGEDVRNLQPAEFLGKVNMSPMCAYLNLQSRAVLLSISTSANIIVYTSSGNLKKETRLLQRANSTKTGLIFTSTVRLLEKDDKFAIIFSDDVNFSSDITEGNVPKDLLETYVPVDIPYTWLTMMTSWFPKWLVQKIEMDKAFREAAFNLAVNFWIEALCYIEKFSLAVIKVITNIVLMSQSWGVVIDWNGPRVKPSIPAANMPFKTNYKFNALNALGIQGDLIAPDWNVDGVEPDILVRPDTLIAGKKSWEYEDVIDNHFRKCQKVMDATGKNWNLDKDYRRKYNQNPDLSDIVTRRRAMAVELLQAEIGVNNRDYATEEATEISLERYAKTDMSNKVTSSDIKEYADYVHSQDSDEYKGFRLWSPERTLKDLKRKMNLNYGFEGAKTTSGGEHLRLKKRSDLLKFPEARKELLRLVKKDLMASVLDPIVHSSFPKDYKNFEGKLAGKPEKLRTIVTPDLFSLLSDACIFKSTDLEMKRNWKTSSTVLGVPWKALALNETMGKDPNGNQNLIVDFSDYDSTHGKYASELLSELYAPGFDNLSKADQDVIKQQIKMRWQRLHSGGIIYDLNWGIRLPKVRGSSTGSVSVTRPNIEIAKFALTKTFSVIWGCSISEAGEKLKIRSMGDDNKISNYHIPVELEEFQQVMLEECGLKVTFEYEKRIEGGIKPDWNGATFLSHKMVNSSEHREELIEAGLGEDTPAWPRYCYEYDPEKLAMRQTLTLTRTNIFKEYDSLKSYMQKAIHHPKSHAALAMMARELIPDILKRKNGSKFLDKRPILTYNDELRLFYNKLYKIKEYNTPFVNTTLNAFTTTIAINMFLINFFQIARNTGIHALGSPRPLETSSPLINTGKYTVEMFVYFSYIELTGNVPSYEAFAKSCGGNPYASLTNPAEAWEFINDGKNVHRLKIMKQFSYYKYQYLSLTFIIVRSIAGAFQKQYVFLSLLNSLYTLLFGIPAFWWGLASELGTLANGHASPKISGMIARDPFRLSKTMTSFFVDLMPEYVFSIGVPRYIFQGIEKIIIDLIKTFTGKDPMLGLQGMTNTPMQETSWRAFYTSKIKPALNLNRHIAVHAPTGSGKSQALGNLLLSDYGRVFYVVPRRNAASEMRGFTRIDRNAEWPSKDGKYVMTAGHAINRLLKDPKFNLAEAIMVFDEYDEGDSYQMIMAFELDKLNIPFILLSATSNLKIQEKLNVTQSMNLRIKSPYTVKSYLAPVYSSLTSLAAYNYTSFNRILIIEPGIRKCEMIRDSLSSLDLDVDTMFSGDPIPVSKIIVASQVAEKSITIPGVDLVLDSGTMVRSSEGEVFLSTNDMNTMIQRKGRTGRTCNGTYITMKHPVNVEINTFPPAEIALSFPETVEQIYGIDMDVHPLLNNPGYVKLNANLGVVINSVPPKYRIPNGVLMLGSIKLNSTSLEVFEHMLDQIRLGTENDKTEYIFAQHSTTLLTLPEAFWLDAKSDANIIYDSLSYIVQSGNSMREGPNISITKSGIAMFKGDTLVKNKTINRTLRYSDDSLWMDGENMPTEVAAIVSPYLKNVNLYWKENFVSITSYYISGNFLNQTEISSMKDFHSNYSLPLGQDSFDTLNQVMATISIIGTALSCSFNLIDASNFRRRYISVNNVSAAGHRLNLIWTATGKLMYYRTMIAFPIMTDAEIDLRTYEPEIEHLIPDPEEYQPDTEKTEPYPEDVIEFNKQDELLKDKSVIEVDTCAFDAVTDMFSMIAQNEVTLASLWDELTFLNDGMDIGTQPPSLSKIRSFLLREFDHLRLNNLADPTEILETLGNRYGIRQNVQQENLVLTRSNKSSQVNLLRIGFLDIEENFLIFNDIEPSGRLIFGDYVIIQCEITERDFRNNISDYLLLGDSSTGKAIYAPVGAFVSDPGNYHHVFYTFEEFLRSWTSVRDGTKNNLPDKVIALVFKTTSNKQFKPTPSKSTEDKTLPSSAELDDFLDANGYSDLLPNLPKTERISLFSNRLFQSDGDEQIGIFADSPMEVKCLDKSIIGVLNQLYKDIDFAQQKFISKIKILSAHSEESKDLRTLKNFALLLDEEFGYSLVINNIFDRFTGLECNFRCIGPSMKNKFIMLCNYQKHIFIGSCVPLKTWQKRAICSTLLSKVYEELEFFEMSADTAGSRIFENSVILKHFHKVETEDLTGMAKTLMRNNPDILSSARVMKPQLKHALSCTIGSNKGLCGSCLALSNYVSCSPDSIKIIVRDDIQYSLFSRPTNENHVKTMLLDKRSHVVHKISTLK